MSPTSPVYCAAQVWCCGQAHRVAAVEKAAATHLGRVYLGFSRFPAVRTFVDPDGVTTVRWEDMRFADLTTSPNRPNQRSNLFTAIVRIGPDGRVLEERLGQ